MAQAEVIQRIRPPQVIEGTPKEIAERLKTLGGDKRLTLIIPGEEIATSQRREPTEEEPSQADMTFRQIFAPSQPGFDRTGLTEDELADFVEAEVKAYRAERRAKEQQGK